MKTMLRASLSLSVLLLTAAALVCGCALKVTREPEPKTTLRVVEDHYRQAASQIDAVEDALMDLLTAEEFDVRQAAAEFRAVGDRMVRVGDRMMRHDDQMRLRGLGYLSEWNQKGGNYLSPQLRMMTKEARDQLSEYYWEVFDASSDARRYYRPFRFDLVTLQAALDRKTNASKVSDFSMIFGKARADAENLKGALEKVLTALDDAKAAMPQGVAQNGNGEGKNGSRPANGTGAGGPTAPPATGPPSGIPGRQTLP